MLGIRLASIVNLVAQTRQRSERRAQEDHEQQHECVKPTAARHDMS
jgi:hypothetical protein